MENPEKEPLDAWTKARDTLLEESDFTREEREWLKSTTPEMVVEDVEKLDGQHANKSWSRKAMTAIKPLLHGLDRFGSALDVFAQADPQGVLTLVWGSLRIVLAFAKQFNQYFEDLTSFLGQVSAPLGRLQEYEKLAPNSERLGKALYGAFARFLGFTLKTRRIFLDKANRTKILDRFGRVLKKDPWRKYTSEAKNDIDEIKRLCDEAREEADLAESQDAAKGRKRAEEFYKTSEDFYKRQNRAVEEAKAQKEKTMFKEIVGWLAPIDMETVLDKFNEDRFPRTCEWVLENEKFNRWVTTGSTEEAPPLLWIHARPGAGKTFLAAHCVELLQESDSVAYFFCDTKVQKRRTSIHVVRTWVNQILQENPLYLPEVEKIFSRSDIPTMAGMKKMLDALLAKMDLCWFVLDGLDECEPQARTELLQICKHLMEKAKILITSRKENDIDRWMTQLDEKKLGTIIIEPEDNCLDIRNYVENRVRDMEIDDEDLETLVIERLIGGANGMFLWVRLMIEDLSEAERDEDLEEALKSLPDGLDELYARVLDRINNFKKESKRETARQLLQWIACAMEPLSIPELEHALAITFDEESFNPRRRIRRTQDFVMETCGPLVEISKNDQHVRMAHASVKDFLLSKNTLAAQRNLKRQLATVLDYLVDETDAHTRVARCCLTYLCYPSSRYVDVNSDPKQSHANLQERLDTDVVLEYATINWWRHILRIPELSSGLDKTLGNFLTSEESAVYWLQMFHKLRGDSTGVYHSGRNPNTTVFSRLLQVRAKWHKVSSDRTWIDNFEENPTNWSFRFYCFISSGWLSYFLPIHIAAFFDFTIVIEKELAAGTPVDACIDQEDTALFCAARGNSVASVQILLRAGADINWIGKHRETAFHRAVSQYGLTSPGELAAIKHDCADVLLDAGINVSQRNFADDRFVHYMCRRAQETDADVRLLKNILDHGGKNDMDAKNRDGASALHISAYNNLPKMTRTLLDAGADPNGGAHENETVHRTPLQSACKTRDPRIARMLIEAGANPNIADPGDRRTPLHTACQFAPESVDLLLEAGANPNLKDSMGSLPIHHAAHENRSKIISRLLTHGSELDAKDSSGRTPLDVATEENAASAIKLLAERGATSRFSKPPRKPTVEPQDIADRFPKSERDTMHAYWLLRRRLPLPHAWLVRALDRAEYWVRATATNRTPRIVQEQDVGPSCVRSAPVAPGLRARPVQKVVFRTRSHDQGFSDWPHLHGTYENSWTGFHARFVRRGREKAEEGKEDHVLVNRHAEGAPRVHTVEWQRGGKGDMFVRGLGVGDIIELVPYAKYPGWVNYVYSASIEIYTACFVMGETRGQ